MKALLIISSFVLGSLRCAAEPLPILSATTQNNTPVDSNQFYIPGEISLRLPKGEIIFSEPMEIRGRGNSTWGFPKNPYKFKLKEKISFLHFPSENEWILLANYSDKTLMRNFLALDFSRNLGLRYTPRTQFVDFYLNAAFLGNYLLTEQIKISPERLDLTPIKKNDISGIALTGSYLLEISQSSEESFSFYTKKGILFNVKSPRHPEPEQANYIKNYIQEVEEAIFSESYQDPNLGYARYIDVEQFIDWYLVNELFRNQDAAIYSSIFFYKDRGGKLAMGPVWDFDIAAGNVNYDENFLTDGWWIQKKSPWFARLFSDPNFEHKVKQRWREIRRNQVEHIFQQIRSTSRLLKESQTENFLKWPILGQYVWPNYMVWQTYEEEVNYLHEWLQARATWLDNQWGADPKLIISPRSHLLD